MSVVGQSCSALLSPSTTTTTTKRDDDGSSNEGKSIIDGISGVRPRSPEQRTCDDVLCLYCRQSARRSMAKPIVYSVLKIIFFLIFFI